MELKVKPLSPSKLFPSSATQNNYILNPNFPDGRSTGRYLIIFYIRCPCPHSTVKAYIHSKKMDFSTGMSY